MELNSLGSIDIKWGGGREKEKERRKILLIFLFYFFHLSNSKGKLKEILAVVMNIWK